MNELEKAIKITKKYGEKYGGWTNEQVKNRLISGKKVRILNSKLEIKDENYKEKMGLAKKFTEKYLKNIENILMVGVTGSVAAENPKKNDDIDLMIIIKKDCLWIVRLKVFIIFWIYKIPHRTNKNDICINLWLDEEALTIPKEKQNLRNAMDLILMKSVLNKNMTYEKFILANKWARKYVRNGFDMKTLNSKLKILNKKIKNNYWEKIINLIMFAGQYWYMKKKINKELVDEHRAFFHPND
jgi:hypothetical protein